MRPILWLCVIAIALPLDYTWCNTQNRWCSVNTLLTLWWRYGDAALMCCWCSSCRVVTMTYTTLPIQAVNTSIMDKSHSCGLGWYYMQRWNILTLCLCWVDARLTLIFRWRDINPNHNDYKGAQFSDYGYKPQHSPWIVQAASPKINDSLLTLIFRMRLWPCRVLLCP
jgi:hypothetical protein